MAEKHDKKEVHYTPHAEVHDERCELCRHFIAMYDKCRLVDGNISAKGWCQLFKRGRPGSTKTKE